MYAENQALRWIADLVGLPESAGGAFVQGGTIGNLSALVAARATARERTGGRPFRIATTVGSHSSIATACRVMDAEAVHIDVDERLRLTGDNLRAALLEHGPDTFFAVVATAGTTNFGIIDDIASVAEVCAEFGLWLHVDGAYGGAGLAAPACALSTRASSGRTPSSSTPTSGCSPRSTAARCFTVTRRSAVRHTPSTRHTST